MYPVGRMGHDRDRISVLSRRHEENIIYPINSANNNVSFDLVRTFWPFKNHFPIPNPVQNKHHTGWMYISLSITQSFISWPISLTLSQCASKWHLNVFFGVFLNQDSSCYCLAQLLVLLNLCPSRALSREYRRLELGTYLLLKPHPDFIVPYDLQYK